MKRSLIKVGLASLVVACGGLAAGLQGCSDNATTDGGTEGGGPDTNTVDTGVDTGTDAAPDATPPPNAKLIAIHASGQLGGLRFCFGINGTVSPLPALPHDIDASPASLGYPGFPPGAGSPLSSTGVSITPLTVTPYVMNANSIKQYTTAQGAAEVRCPALITDAGLAEGTDFWKLPDIPANTFQYGKTYLLALEGCDKSANFGSMPATVAVCGSTWNNTSGNLGLKIYELDSTLGAKMGAQYIHASPIVSVGNPGGAVASVLTPNPDGGAPLKVQIINITPAQYAAAIQPGTATQVDPPGVSDVLYSTFLLADGGTGGALPLPFTAVEQLTTGKAPTGIYKAGDNFTFILIGDPKRTSAGGVYYQDAGQPAASVGPGYALHALGLSNNPVIRICPPDCP